MSKSWCGSVHLDLTCVDGLKITPCFHLLSNSLHPPIIPYLADVFVNVFHEENVFHFTMDLVLTSILLLVYLFRSTTATFWNNTNMTEPRLACSLAFLHLYRTPGSIQYKSQAGYEPILLSALGSNIHVIQTARVFVILKTWQSSWCNKVQIKIIMSQPQLCMLCLTRLELPKLNHILTAGLSQDSRATELWYFFCFSLLGSRTQDLRVWLLRLISLFFNILN